MAIATFLGAIISGIAGDLAGGYKDRRALGVTIIVFGILMAAGIACLFAPNKYVFVAGFFVMIFAENLVEPIFLGLMLNLVKPHEREVANSMSLFLQMLFGYIPGPYVYGLLQDAFPKR